MRQQGKVMLHPVGVGHVVRATALSFLLLHLCGVLPALATSSGSAGAGGSSSSGNRQPPHLMVMLVDDLGYHNVGFHNPQQRSPEIDALATQEGIILEALYTFRYCSPTRSSLMTGRFPIHVNQGNPKWTDDRGGADLRMAFLPEKLKRVGYSTATVGVSLTTLQSRLMRPCCKTDRVMQSLAAQPDTVAFRPTIAGAEMAPWGALCAQPTWPTWLRLLVWLSWRCALTTSPQASLEHLLTE